MLIKEYIQLLRDPRMRGIVFMAPVLQMLVFAWALTTDVNQIKMVVFDQDRTPSSREFLERFTSSGYFKMTDWVNNEDEITALLDRGEVKAALHVPSGFEREISGGGTAEVQLLVDGSDSNTAAIILGYASQISSSYSQAKLAERVVRILGPGRDAGFLQVQTRAWFNPNMESRFFYVPSLICLMLVLVSMTLPSIAIVREKEIGTIEQVMVTPVTRLEFILGKTIPYGIIGYVVMTIMFLAAMLVFGVHLQGNLVLLYLLTGLYLVSNMGLALFVSASASTQQQALLTAFLLMMPIMLLSGFIFPIRNMPQLVQYASMLNPMRWYLEVLRGIVIKGVGIAELHTPILALLILSTCYITLAISRFRKTMG
jgi:ABC-2 type transport system permease protein